MKTTLLLVLLSTVAFAAEPKDEDTVKDAPIADQVSPVLAPPIPGVSVRLKAGETAPFDGRLVDLDENLRRGKAIADCKGELADAKTNEWVTRPVLITLIVVPVVLALAAGAGVTAYAYEQKLKGLQPSP